MLTTPIEIPEGSTGITCDIATETADLRRHFRVMSATQALRAMFRVWAAQVFLTWAYDLLEPHITPSARLTLASALGRLIADFDSAHQGLIEACEIRRGRHQ